MSTAYFDCYSGVAGDMVLGAMIGAGLPLEYLKKELSKLAVTNYKITAHKDKRGPFTATNVHVKVFEGKGRAHTSIKYAEIVDLIRSSRLKKGVKDTALSIFECLARAESKIHGLAVSRIHFHEVGAIDSIVDIVGTAIGLDYFSFDEVYSSSLPVTRGFVRCRHGKVPVPTPVTLEILKGVPLEPAPVLAEIVTPTGAAILKTIVRSFGGNPIRVVKKIGYGCGDAIFKTIPNALRLIIGEGEPLVMIETNIDDMNPKLYEHVIDRLLKCGAVDVTMEQVWMKKGRPGILLKALCEGAKKRKVIDNILRETTTLGVRYYPVQREVLERETKSVKVRGIPINLKIGKKGDEIYNVEPEYEECRALAVQKGIPLKRVFMEAVSKGIK